MANVNWDDFSPIDSPAKQAASPAAVDWDQFEPIEAKTRNPAAVLNDTVISIANAAAGGVGAVADFVAPGNSFSKAIDENIIKAGEAKQSDIVKEGRAKFQAESEAAQGFGEEAAAVGRYVLENPLQAAGQALGSFAGPGLAAAGGRGAAGVLGLGARGARNSGLISGAAVGGAMGGGDAAGDAYDLVMATPDDVLLQNETVRAAVDSGRSLAEVKEEAATTAARKASVVPAVMGAASSLVGAERLLAGGKGFAGGAVSQGLKTGAVEALSEGVEEGATTYSARKAAQEYNPDIDPMKGVGTSATLGAVLGAGPGVAVGALNGAAESPKRTTDQVLDELGAARDVTSAASAAAELSGNLDELTTAVDQYLAQGVPQMGTSVPNQGMAAPQLTPQESLELAASQRAIRDVGTLDITQPVQQPLASAEERMAAADTALRSVEQNNGVATVGQAAVLDAAFPGRRMYDRVEGAAAAEPVASSPIITPEPSNLRSRTTYPDAGQQANAESWAEQEARRTFVAPTDEKIPRGAAPTPPAASSVISAFTQPAALRTAEQKITLDAAQRTYSPEDFTILQTAATAPFQLDSQQRLRLQSLRAEPVAQQETTVSESATPKLSTGRVSIAEAAAVPEGTISEFDPEQLQDTAEGNDLDRNNYRLIEQIGRVFGKRVALFEGDISDGFVNPDLDPDTIYINRNSTVAHLAVFGHELLHTLRKESPEAYRSFATVVAQNLDRTGRAAFREDYGSGANIEELTADLLGNRFRDPDFWANTFNDIVAQTNETEARGVVSKLAGALYSAVDRAIKALRGQGFRADAYVKDLEQVKAAARQALKTYAAERKIPAMQLEAEIAKAKVMADNVSVANQGAQNARPDNAAGAGRLQSPARQDRPESGRDRGDQVPEYGTARDGAITVQGVHYSRDNRTSLDSRFYGTGLKGEELARIQRSGDARLRQRIYLYANTGRGISPEEGVGSYPHTVRLNNIYDPSSRLIAPQSDANAFEAAVIDAGFDGYLNRSFGAVVLLGQRTVPVAPFTGEAPQVAAADQSASVGSRLQSMRSLPAGELSRSRWGQVLKTTAPDVYAELEPTGAFTGEEKVYKDGLVKRSAKRAEIGADVDAISGIENAFARAREGSFNTNRELKVFLQDAVRTAAGKKDLSRAKKYLVGVGVKDAMYALKSNANAVGWYDTTVKKAMNILATLHPEIATDPNSKFAFTWALAVTSNGLKVDKNFELAEAAYRSYKKNGVMPTNIQTGQAQKAINESMGLFNEMVAKYGIENMRKFMADKFKVSQIERATGVPVTGEFKDTEVRGAAILGPKIGNGFFSNLNGYFDQLTMDRWLMRTWGRWTGTLIEARPDMVKQKREELGVAIREMKRNPKATKAFEEALGRKLTVSNLDEVAQAIQKASVKPELRAAFNETSVGETLRKVGNGLAKYLDGQKEAPAGPEERNFIREVFGEILQDLRQQGYEALTMSDLQALLWYPEKRLYDVAKSDEATEGYEDDEAPDYANAAAKLARDNGVSEEEIKNATNVSSAGAERSAGNGEAEARVEGRDAGFAQQERRTFLLQGVLRSYRDADASAQPYSRRSAEGTRRLRVLGQEAVAQYSPATKFKNALGAADAPAPKFFELDANGAALFSDSIKAAKDASVYGAAVYVYPEEDYRAMRLFVTEDGKSGFALKGDDIVSVFSTTKGASTAMLQLAAQEGGRRLDAFDTALPDIYAVNGFRVVARLPWNDEYRPDDWNKATFQKYNGGEPDVVFMVYDPANASPEGGVEVSDYEAGIDAQREALGTAEERLPKAEAPKLSKPRFYSQLERTIEQVPERLQTQPAQQWKAWLASNASKFGVKKDELEWSGVNDYLDLRGKEKVTAAEIGEYLDLNNVKIQEVTKGGTPQIDYSEVEELPLPASLRVEENDDERMSQYPFVVKTVMDGRNVGYGKTESEALDDAFSGYPEYWNDSNPADGPKFTTWTLPGGTNDREMMLALPAQKPAEQPDRPTVVDRGQAEDGRGRFDVVRNGEVLDTFNTWSEATDAAYGIFQDESIAINLAAKPTYLVPGAHQYGDVASDVNRLLHIRMNDRTDANGDKVLFIEELQSDWGQAMRAGQNVPPAPFLKNTKDWVALGVKRILLLAAQEGYDKVAFINGEQSADRYNLAKQIDYIEYDKTGDNQWFVKAVGNTRQAVLTKYQQTPEQLEEIVGKEIAQKIVNNEGTRDVGEPKTYGLLRNADLKVGGEGMKSFYDRIVPQVVGDVLKKLGGKMETVTLELPRAMQVSGMSAKEERAWAGGKQPGFTVTPEMREKLQGDGLPLFSKKRAQTDTAEFQQWFGDSKTVEADGSPIMFYRGQGASFNNEPLDNRYFTRDPGYASEYDLDEDVNVLPVFIKAENIYTPNDINRVTDYDFDREALLKQGYDAIASKDLRVIVPLKSPSQVKSAAGNVGTFDANNPDIRYSNRRAFGQLSQQQEQALSNVGGLPLEATIRQRFMDLRKSFAGSWRQGLFDQFAPLKALSQEAYMHARLSKGSDGTLEAAMMYGRPYLNKDGIPDVNINDRGFAKTLATLKGEHDRFLWWVSAQRAERLKALGLENLFTDVDISSLKTLDQGTFADGSDRAPVYAKALEDLNAFNDSVLEMAEKSGLIDPQARVLFRNTPYVPFYRVMDGNMTGPKFSSGLVNQTAWKRLKGGSAQLNSDLLANVLMNWSHLYTAAANNRAAAKALEAGKAMGIADVVPSGTKGAVKVMENGQAVHYVVSDPYVMEAVTALEYVSPSFFKPFSMFKRWLTIAVTANPAFKIRNLIRDSLSAIGTAELSYNPVANVASGFKATSKETQTYASMLAGGGVIRFGSMVDGDRAHHARRLVEREGGVLLDAKGWDKLSEQMRTVITTYNELGDRMENVNRAALYEQLIAKGHSSVEANFMARDLMDFSMSGRWPVVRFLAQVVPFMNARLQGLYKLGRSAKDNPRRFGYVVGAVALASIGLMLAYEDDDDWKKRPDWDRDSNWWFKIGDTAFRIPKPFEIGAIGTLAERTLELFISKEMTGKRYRERLSNMVFDTFAMDPTPQIVKPLLDVYANKAGFTGKPIETMGQEKLRPQDRVNANTSNVAKFLGRLGLPDPAMLAKGEYKALSPVQVDYLIRGYFGWLGTSAVTMVDYGIRPMLNKGERPEMRLKDAFLLGNFVESLPSGSSRYVDQMYSQAQEIEQAYQSWRDALKKGDGKEAKAIFEAEKAKIVKYKQAENVKDRVQDINKRIKLIEASKTLSGETKRKMMDQLEQQKDKAARFFQPLR